MGRSNPSIEALRSGSATLLESIRHEQLIPFVQEYFFRRTSWVTRLHHTLSIAALVALIGVGIAGFRAGQFFLQFGLGLAVMIVIVLPLHEALHAVAYRLCGARDIRWAFSWRMLAAYVVADRFVADRRMFFFVALAPFVVITPAALALATVDSTRAILWLTVLLWHTAGVSGDWALLNYYWMQRGREIYTFDEDGTSYFYADGL